MGALGREGCDALAFSGAEGLGVQGLVAMGSTIVDVRYGISTTAARAV